MSNLLDQALATIKNAEVAHKANIIQTSPYKKEVLDEISEQSNTIDTTIDQVNSIKTDKSPEKPSLTIQEVMDGQVKDIKEAETAILNAKSVDEVVKNSTGISLISGALATSSEEELNDMQEKLDKARAVLKEKQDAASREDVAHALHDVVGMDVINEASKKIHQEAENIPTH